MPETKPNGLQELTFTVRHPRNLLLSVLGSVVALGVGIGGSYGVGVDNGATKERTIWEAVVNQLKLQHEADRVEHAADRELFQDAIAVLKAQAGGLEALGAIEGDVEKQLDRMATAAERALDVCRAQP